MGWAARWEVVSREVGLGWVRFGLGMAVHGGNGTGGVGKGTYCSGSEIVVYDIGLALVAPLHRVALHDGIGCHSRDVVDVGDGRETMERTETSMKSQVVVDVTFMCCERENSPKMHQVQKQPRQDGT